MLFGLGSNARVDRIEIFWPDGRTQELLEPGGEPDFGIDQNEASYGS